MKKLPREIKKVNEEYFLTDKAGKKWNLTRINRLIEDIEEKEIDEAELECEGLSFNIPVKERLGGVRKHFNNKEIKSLLFKDCLENTNEKGKRDIKNLDRVVTPNIAKTISKAYEHLTTPALLSFIEEKAKQRRYKNSVNSEEVKEATIKIIGIGKFGCEAVSLLHKRGIQGAEIVIINKDIATLFYLDADKKILLKEEYSKILMSIVKDTNMLFLCFNIKNFNVENEEYSVAKYINKIAKENKKLIVNIVITPFGIKEAKKDVIFKELKQGCHSMIVIENKQLTKKVRNLHLNDRYPIMNELISITLKNLVENMAIPTIFGLDYADVEAILKKGGICTIGIGESSSKNKVDKATNRSLNNLFSNVNYKEASGAIVHISGGDDLTLEEVSKAGEMVTSALDADANVIWGARIGDYMGGKLRVMTILTGIKE